LPHTDNAEEQTFLYPVVPRVAISSVQQLTFQQEVLTSLTYKNVVSFTFTFGSVKMAHRKDSNSVTRNKEIWKKNLARFRPDHPSVRRPSIPSIEEPLSTKKRMPTKAQVVGRYNHLGLSIKGRRDRVGVLAEEVTNLWTHTLNFPIISKQAIISKLEKLLKVYDECVRRSCFEKLDSIFDITKEGGVWLNSEDKKLHRIQVETKGRVGYSTSTPASNSTIHPSKRSRLTVTTDEDLFERDLLTTESEDTGPESGDCYEPDDPIDLESEGAAKASTSRRKKQTTTVAVKMITQSNVSTHKAAKLCRNLSKEGISIPTPTQGAVYRAIFRRAAEVLVMVFGA
jgi:hypothetical protein